MIGRGKKLNFAALGRGRESLPNFLTSLIAFPVPSYAPVDSTEGGWIKLLVLGAS